jgi:hypothetical protein
VRYDIRGGCILFLKNRKNDFEPLPLFPPITKIEAFATD